MGKLKYTNISKRNKIILAMAKEFKTLEQIGAVFGLSKERIRQIYKELTGQPYMPVKLYRPSTGYDEGLPLEQTERKMGKIMREKGRDPGNPCGSRKESP